MLVGRLTKNAGAFGPRFSHRSTTCGCDACYGSLRRCMKWTLSRSTRSCRPDRGEMPNHIDHRHPRFWPWLWEIRVHFPHIIRPARSCRSVIFVRTRIGGPFRQLTRTLGNSRRPRR